MRKKETNNQRIKFAGIGTSVLVVNVVIMAFTTPQAIGPLGIVLWFILLSLGLFFLALSLFTSLSGEIYRRIGILSVVIVTILALQSLHQLSVRDIVLIIVLAGLVEFYLTKSGS